MWHLARVNREKQQKCWQMRANKRFDCESNGKVSCFMGSKKTLTISDKNETSLNLNWRRISSDLLRKIVDGRHLSLIYWKQILTYKIIQKYILKRMNGAWELSGF